MADVLERLNLNVPSSVRKQLREMAAREGRTEAEVARSLLLSAVERARRDDIYRRVAEAYTPELRARDLKFVRALERLNQRRG